MKIDGRCQCGAITYEARIDPALVTICNCADCQAFSGAPFRASVPVKPDAFTLTGTPATYVKTGSSGAKRVQAFCGTCGSALYSTEHGTPKYFNLRLGGCRQRADLPAKHQTWQDSALAWAQDVRAVPSSPRDRGT